MIKKISKVKLMILLLILIILIFCVLFNSSCFNAMECFTDTWGKINTKEADYIQFRILNSKDDSLKINHNDVPTYYYNNYNNNNNCCLVNKKVGENGFTYTYEKLNDDNCNPDNYTTNNNTQLYIDGVNNWSNDNCTDNKLGSCRQSNKECVDFQSKDTCDKYKLTWSELTCNDPLPFVWQDKIAHNISQNNILKSVKSDINVMFPLQA
jgi:hypothetical protein